MNRTRFGWLCAGLIAWVAVLLFAGRHFDTRDYWAIMLIGAALITFFTIMYDAWADVAQLEARVRLAILSAVLVAYFVYFGSVVYLDVGLDDKGNRIKTFADEIFPTLTSLVGVAVSFYFAASAAVQISKDRRP